MQFWYHSFGALWKSYTRFLICGLRLMGKRSWRFEEDSFVFLDHYYPVESILNGLLFREERKTFSVLQINQLKCAEWIASLNLNGKPNSMQFTSIPGNKVQLQDWTLTVSLWLCWISILLDTTCSLSKAWLRSLVGASGHFCVCAFVCDCVCVLDFHGCLNPNGKPNLTQSISD